MPLMRVIVITGQKLMEIENISVLLYSSFGKVNRFFFKYVSKSINKSFVLLILSFYSKWNVFLTSRLQWTARFACDMWLFPRNSSEWSLIIFFAWFFPCRFRDVKTWFFTVYKTSALSVSQYNQRLYAYVGVVSLVSHGTTLNLCNWANSVCLSVQFCSRIGEYFRLVSYVWHGVMRTIVFHVIHGHRSTPEITWTWHEHRSHDGRLKVTIYR